MLSIMATRRRAVTTAWGAATVVEEVSLSQRAGDRRYSAIVQLLDGEHGERLVRFAYATGGAARRGPLTLRERDLERLRTALRRRPAPAAALGLGSGDA